MTDSSKQIDEEKILEEIKKGGSSLEIRSAITLNKKGWVVKPSLDYFDPLLGDYREADIIAFMQSKIKNIFNILVIECKKSENKPWVFYKTKKTRQFI